MKCGISLQAWQFQLAFNMTLEIGHFEHSEKSRDFSHPVGMTEQIELSCEAYRPKRQYEYECE